MAVDSADHRTPSWQDAARLVQEHRDATLSQIEGPIPETSDTHPSRVISLPRQYLTSAEISITEKDAGALVASLAAGELSATEVVKAFLHRAVIAQKLVNCVNELLPERALARAKELDEYYAQHKRPIGPLHGLPISVKSHVGMKDLESNTGFASWVGRKSPDDANVLKILLAAGAVLYVRTTEPQGLMMIETSNNLNGVTLNPHNTALTPGGSSGGESALQALRGSPLGIGSDIGGSTRTPAANCGIYGFRPTACRLPAIGICAYNMGCDTIMGTLGPMAPSLEAIDLFMKTVVDSEPWTTDLSLHQMPWRKVGPFLSAGASKKLTVGVMWDDGVVKPAPSVTRALQEVVAKLKDVPNVEVIEWKPYKHDEAIEVLVGLYTPDGGKTYVEQISRSGEPFHSLTAWTFKGTPGIRSFDHQELWELSMKREILRYSYLQVWNSVAPEMDVILCPTTPTPAPLHNTSRYWGYGSVWNLLDYPAISFPVTKIDPQRDAKDPSYTPRNDMDRHYYEIHDPVKQADAPVALQLVAKKMEDEKVLQVMKEIKENIGLPFVDCLAE